MSSIIYPNQIEYLESLRAEPDPLIKEMEEFARENRVPILDWKSAELLEQIVLMIKPKRVLEIGTAIAYSSIRIARRLKKKGTLDTIEKSLDNIALASEYIRRAELTSKINLIEGDALAVMPQLEKKYDLIFLDADKEDYEKLFYYSLVLLKKGGVLFVDNLLWHGYAASSKVPTNYRNSTKAIREFNKLFMNQDALWTTIFSIGDGIGLGVKI
ncbi:MAG: O-methyltransferase [Ignavibacteriales bacterium]|nr:O-methyltransferase [Ignavibacteriales bacterium]